MKIVFITRGPYGFMGSNASYMVPSILSRRADATVLAPAPRANERSLIVFEDPEVKVVDIGNGKVIARAEESASLIEEIDPDIVHVFGHPSCFVFPMISRRIQRRQRKWLLDIRTHIFGLSKPRLLIEKSMNTYLQRYFDHICHTAEPSLNTVLYWPRKRTSWVPIGINLSIFDEPKPKVPSTPFRFVFVGSIAKARRLDALVANFGYFAKRASRPVMLNLYGDGNGVEAIRQIIGQNGYEDFVRLHGVVPSSDVGGILSENDAGIVYLPKDKFNNAPALKRIEYAAAGIPIVESDTDYHKLNPEEFRTVLFSDDPDEFAATMEAFVTSEYRFEDVLHNREQAKRFDWHYIVDNDLMPIYSRFMRELGQDVVVNQG